MFCEPSCVIHLEQMKTINRICQRNLKLTPNFVHKHCSTFGSQSIFLCCRGKTNKKWKKNSTLEQHPMTKHYWLHIITHCGTMSYEWLSNTLDINTIRWKNLATILSGQKYVARSFVNRKKVNTSAGCYILALVLACFEVWIYWNKFKCFILNNLVQQN